MHVGGKICAFNVTFYSSTVWYQESCAVVLHYKKFSLFSGYKQWCQLPWLIGAKNIKNLVFPKLDGFWNTMPLLAAALHKLHKSTGFDQFNQRLIIPSEFVSLESFLEARIGNIIQ